MPDTLSDMELHARPGSALECLAIAEGALDAASHHAGPGNNEALAVQALELADKAKRLAAAGGGLVVLLYRPGGPQVEHWEVVDVREAGPGLTWEGTRPHRCAAWTGLSRACRCQAVELVSPGIWEAFGDQAPEGV